MFLLLSTVLIEGAWSRQPEAVFLRAPRSPSHALPGVAPTPAPWRRSAPHGQREGWADDQTSVPQGQHGRPHGETGV